MISQILFPVAGSVLCYGVYQLGHFLYGHLTHPLRNVDGPPSPSFFLGNFKDMATDAYLTKRWHDEFGPIFQFKGLFNTRQLHISDVKALNHVIGRSVYQRPPATNEGRKAVVGNSVLVVGVEEHRRQRRILDRAFGIAQIRAVTEIFVDKAVQLRDIWAAELAKNNGAPARLDVFDWLRRMTLDVIGQAGFGYKFHALETGGMGNALNDAFHELIHGPDAQRNILFMIAQAMMPILKLVPFPGRKALADAHSTMFSVAAQIVSESKEAILAAEGEKALDSKRDLLSVLLKANLSTSVPENQRLTETEVVSQIPTFFAAGHETTSAATSWALHEFSLHPNIQEKLRSELFTVSTDNPTMEQLNSLPYLENVVREILRVHAPVPSLERIATQDDVLPLSKPYIDKAGRSYDTLLIPKGLIIHIPIWTVQTDKGIWGEDAGEFRPERWENVPEAVAAIPGVWANLLTFYAGPTNCKRIGFRFSLTEMKALLFTLVRAFEFEPGVPEGGIGPTSAFLQVPVILSEPEKGGNLPLILKPYNAEKF
ncbi:Cytochrome P450 [Mycena venus]|uniref:Cytochrome P450 n=1 Tax=Mycena venus TaxID=2733690 RepID=A0A8H6XDX3_9AGAR|nr:Cytochrome P450 [Mycena venus]